MSEEEEHPNYHEEFVKQVIEDEANNPQQTYSVISALLPSHQISTSPIQEKITSQTLRTLRKQRLLKLSDSDRPDSKRSSTDTLESWGDNLNASDDEVFVWKLLMIQSMPLPMTVKRKHKRQLENTHGGQLARKARKTGKKTVYSRFKDRLREIFSSLAVWQHSIKHVEGHFGTSIASYFIFIRLLFVLNFGISAIMMVFIVIPQIVNSANYTFKADLLVQSCSEDYYSKLHISQALNDQIPDFLQGRGWMETTYMFIGGYGTGAYNFSWLAYDIPLAYMLTTIVFLFVSLIFMLRSLAIGFKENAITSESHLYNYCNTVFSSWDFCVTEDRAAEVKKHMIKTELLSCLADEEETKKREQRTNKENILLYLIRVGVNIVILAMLGTAFFTVYKANEFMSNFYASSQSVQISSNGSNITAAPQENERSETLDLLIEYLPSLTITALNISFPLVFYYLVQFENYSPAYVIKINLGRTVFLRLVSIFMLLYSFNDLIKQNAPCSLTCISNGNCAKLKCWETYIGQQLYKLILLDAVIAVISTFGIGLLRMVLVTKVPFELFKMIGREEFDIPKHVLDLVYSQTLCWLGAFFCPFIPCITFVKFFVIFYIKKFHLTVNCGQPSKPYRASKSNSFFMIVLLVSFGSLVLIPLTFTVAAIRPSRGCSPFRMKADSMWQTISDPIQILEAPFNAIVNFVGTPGFSVPVIIILALFIYYNYTLTATYRSMASELKEHLQMEGRDKQFLLTRVRQWRDSGKLSQTLSPTQRLRKRNTNTSLDEHFAAIGQMDDNKNYHLY